MIDRVESKNGIKPERLIGDTAYGTAEMLGWIVNDKEISLMCQCGKSTHAQMAHSQTLNSHTTLKQIATPVLLICCI